MDRKRFTRFTWAVLIANLGVIIWGAYVRASGSGAGCGSHWPLCNGEIIPQDPQIQTLVEFSHRLTSGLALLSVVAMLIWALRLYPKGHPVRLGAGLSMFFMITEALIGAGLVLFQYVATNVSIARAYWMAGHLTNTFLLLAVLTLTVWWASGGGPLRWRGRGLLTWSFGLAGLGLLVLGASGGVTALGDTLTLHAGISPLESPIVAGLIELRIYHPLLALTVGALVALAAWAAHRSQPMVPVGSYAGLLLALYLAQLLAGILNVYLRAPIWLQLFHLLLADLIWITFILLAAAVFGAPVAMPGQERPAGRPAVELSANR